MRVSLFRSPYNKDPTIWGTILGPPYFRKRPAVGPGARTTSYDPRTSVETRGLRFRVLVRAPCLGFRVQGSGFTGSGFRV